MSKDVVNILIVGDTSYDNTYKLQNLIYKLNVSLQKKIKVATFGKSIGIQSFAKQFCLKYQIPYCQFTDYDRDRQEYSLMPKHMFNKSNSRQVWYVKLNHAFKWSDLIIFCNNTQEMTTQQKILFDRSKKENKKYIFYYKKRKK